MKGSAVFREETTTGRWELWDRHDSPTAAHEQAARLGTSAPRGVAYHHVKFCGEFKRGDNE